MKDKFLLLRTDGSYEEVHLDPADLLNEMYKAIGCRCIETVRVDRVKAPHRVDRMWEQPINALLIADEEGLLAHKGINQAVMACFGIQLVGDVLIAADGIRDGEPDIVGLSQAKLRTLVYACRKNKLKETFRQLEEEHHE